MRCRVSEYETDLQTVENNTARSFIRNDIHLYSEGVIYGLS